MGLRPAGLPDLWDRSTWQNSALTSCALLTALLACTACDNIVCDQSCLVPIQPILVNYSDGTLHKSVKECRAKIQQPNTKKNRSNPTQNIRNESKGACLYHTMIIISASSCAAICFRCRSSAPIWSCGAFCGPPLLPLLPLSPAYFFLPRGEEALELSLLPNCVAGDGVVLEVTLAALAV